MTATLTRPVLPTALVEGLDDPVTDGAVKTKELVIVAESGDLERTWATTILASTAAAGEMKVSIFFTFWGLFALVRPEVRVTGTNWMQKMLAIMNRPGIDHAKLSKLNFAGMGPVDDEEARQAVRRGRAARAARDGPGPRRSPHPVPDEHGHDGDHAPTS